MSVDGCVHPLTQFIHLPMKMEPKVSSETSVIITQTLGNYPNRNKLYRWMLFIITVCIKEWPYVKWLIVLLVLLWTVTFPLLLPICWHKSYNLQCKLGTDEQSFINSNCERKKYISESVIKETTYPLSIFVEKLSSIWVDSLRSLF